MAKYIIANWKMNLNVPAAKKYLSQARANRNRLIIAAPFTILPEIQKQAAAKKIQLAGQNVCQFESGAFTGEVSATMLKEVGCSFCLVGHSERRKYFQETDQMINAKIKMLLAKKIRPIVCIGENLSQRQKKSTDKVLTRQLLAALAGISNPAQILIAYEPVWAISTFQKSSNKKCASLADITEAHHLIRSVLNKKYGRQAAAVPIIYGGTVTPENSQAILNLKEVAGALVGGASLKVSGLNAIMKYN